MNLRRTSIIGVFVSIAAIVVYMLILDVKPLDIASVGYQAFIIASLLAFIRLMVQGIRFHIIIRRVLSPNPIAARKSILVRIASEFVTYITPSYVGGETVRIAWLSKQGAKAGQAIWVAYTEVLCDVIVGTSVSIIAAIFALQNGVYLTGAIILVISVAILGFYIWIAILSVKNRMQLPHFLTILIRALAGRKRAEIIEEKVKKVSISYGESANEFVRSLSPLLVLKLLASTLAIVLLAGSIFLVIGRSVGLPVDLFLSTLSVYVAITIGSIPITIGGSGLSELGISLFASGTLGSIEWGSIIVWRIVSYHVPLAICSIALVATTFKEIGKTTKDLSSS